MVHPYGNRSGRIAAIVVILLRIPSKGRGHVPRGETRLAQQAGSCTCSRGNNPRYVVGTMEPPRTDPEGWPPPPKHPIEFGITSGSSVQWMYEGSHDYAKDGGHKELRLIARVDVANYAVMMVKAPTGITDLRQINERRLPVRIITTESAGNMPILKYYGIAKKELEFWRRESATNYEVKQPDRALRGPNILSVTPGQRKDVS